MDGLVIIGYVFGGWALCSLVMMFFLPLLQEKGELDGEQSYFTVAFAPLALPIVIGIAIFAGAYQLGKKIWT